MSDGGQTQEDLDTAKSAAREKGFTVIEPAPNHLLLDLDGDAALAFYESAFPDFAKRFTAKEIERWRSKSKGWHVVVALDGKFSAVERCALQAALGSDGKREWLAIGYLQNGVLEPSCLFRPPTEEPPK